MDEVTGLDSRRLSEGDKALVRRSPPALSPNALTKVSADPSRTTLLEHTLPFPTHHEGWDGWWSRSRLPRDVTPWAERRAMLVWRGSVGDLYKNRDELVRQSEARPDVVDALGTAAYEAGIENDPAITGWKEAATPSASPTPVTRPKSWKPAPTLSMKEQERYKYSTLRTRRVRWGCTRGA